MKKFKSLSIVATIVVLGLAAVIGGYIYTTTDGYQAKALYDADAAMTLRKSHESPVIKMLYDEYFEAPGKHKAHELLHTTYVKRGTH